MRTAVGAAEDRCVVERRTHLDLDVVREGNAISGRLAVAGGAPREFTGYAGLIAALESIREPEPQQPGPGRLEGEHPR